METIQEAEIIKPKKTYQTKINKQGKALRYFKAKQNGKNKEQAKEIAQYRPSTTTTDIEASKQYQAIEQTYLKDHLPQAITKQEVANKLAENIRSQEGSTSNTAIKLYKDIAEPDNQDQRVQDNVIIVFKAENKDDTSITLIKENATGGQLDPSKKAETSQNN